MVKEEGYNISETGNWNVASDFSKLKIMKPLYLSDEYYNIAKFGYSNLLEELEGLSNYPVEYLKIKGFERLVSTLITLIENSFFAIKNSGDKDKLKEYKRKLKEIENYIPLLYKLSRNYRTNEQRIKILEPKYSKALELVLEIKMEINEPLNKSHLIFTDKEEFDPKAYKKRIIEEATTKG